jgi:hypothetical protein
MRWGSTRGGHEVVRCDNDRLNRIAARLKPFQVGDAANQPGVFHIPSLPDLELRLGGYKKDGVVKQLQSVVPPTPGTNGKPREWNGVEAIADAPEAFYRALEAIADEVEAQAKPKSADVPRVKPIGAAGGATNGADKYLRTALANAVSRIESKGPGERRDTYRNEAYNLAGWLHYHENFGVGYSEPELTQSLKSALAVGVSYGDPVVERTVDEAIAAGKLAPRDLKADVHQVATKGATNGKASRNGTPPADPPPNAVATEPSGRPPIIVTTEEHEVNDQAVAALAGDTTVYQRGFMLTTVRRSKATTKGIIRPAGCPQIAPLPLPGLRERLAKFAVWKKWRKLRDGELESVPTHPPDWSVSAVAARGEWPAIRPLEAVIEAPVLRYDGTILDVPGYDPDTALLYEPNAAFLTVKARPTLTDAKAAAGRLLDLVIDFPFASDAHRAAWLAALLTPQSRFAIAGPCPLFLFDATAAGSGKSMLADIISYISTGREMARTDYPDCNEEMRKTITAVALAGDPVMLLDNVATTFGCSALDSALTARTWKNRILGRSEMTPELPLFTVWFATGNNIGLRGDVMRRIIPCRLEPKVERPEERTDFKQPKLMRYVQDNRPSLVADVLTITRAYFAAGRPDQKLTPLGSFDEWSDVVRSAVVWVIGADPCEAREDLRAADDTATNAAGIIEGWYELTSTPDVDKKLTAAQALKLLRDHPTAYGTLREAIMSWSRNDELPSQRAVGIRLNTMRGKVVGGKYMHGDQLKGTWLWSVGIVPHGGTGGTGGTHSNPSRQNCDDKCNTKFRGNGANNSHQSHQSHKPHSCDRCFRTDCPGCDA